MSRSRDTLETAVLDTLLGPVQDQGVKTVVSRGGRIRGKVVGGPHRCRLSGCRGVTYSVRWPDGKLTRPCTEGMMVLNAGKGLWQIQ